jgi:hypothetical protein
LNRKQPLPPPVPPRLDGKAEARLIGLRCGRPPEGRTRWTLQLPADKMVALKVVGGLSHETARGALERTS